ncbi:MAG: glycoside hydrolase/phage tail family protein, partial [Opitutales bacterium]
GSVLSVVSWFGDDLRCGSCSLRPKVEHREADGSIPWRVAGLDRLTAEQVPEIDEAPVYGGTPADVTVIEALRDLKNRGFKVVFYPFILMDQVTGNGRRDPWTGAADQPPLPWRGRITLSVAPGQPGSPDRTVQAEEEVAAFFGTARASDFSNDGSSVSYSGPDEWGMRRFILHQAALCRAAGGVDAFCIGTEMRGITQIRGDQDSFPGVAAFVDLLHEVRAMLGNGTKLSYAADWSEYFGYTPPEGDGSRFFHLDPLWADDDVDFIGIDNYMPLSDWRDGNNHADVDWGSIYNLDYLKANVAGGEGFDWYYADASAAEAQLRTPITDGAYGEPWVWRYKDLRSWWEQPHHDRPGGVRSSEPTAWVPQSKPIWFTELGCAALDKGTNQPNKFLDPKSSESVLPRASDGSRDDLIQMQYLRAMHDYWSADANNPVSARYGGRMVNMGRAHVWTWDARPYPWFPGLQDVWSDGPNYIRGHWLNGRTGAQLLSSVVSEICRNAGLPRPEVADLHGLVRGYSSSSGSARAMLEPLMLAYGFDAHEREGKLVFRSRSARPSADLSVDAFAQHPDQDHDLERIRAAEAEIAGRVRLNHVEADADFEVRAVEVALPGHESVGATQSEVSLVMTAAEARSVAERWLAESRVSRETARFALPLSRTGIGAGDVVAIPDGSTTALYRIDRCEQQELLLLEGVRVEPGIYRAAAAVEEIPRLRARPAPVPPSAMLMDLPQLRDSDRARLP